MSKEDAMTAYIDLVNNLALEDEEVSCETREARATSE